MQTPSAADPSFKAFLEKLKEQNGAGSLLQKDSLQNVDSSKGLGEVKDSLKQGLQGVSDSLVKVQDRLDTSNKSLLNISAAIQAQALDKAVESSKAKEKEEEDNFDPSLMGRLKFFMTDGLSDRPGFNETQKPSKEVVKKEREAKVSSPREENPEADNINTSGEIQADTAKKDLEISKEMLDTTKDELTLLKEIKDALAPKTPAELGNNNALGLGAVAGAAIAPEAPSSPGINIDLPVPGLPDKKDGKPGKPGKETGKAVAKGIGKSLLKKIPIVGAVAGLAYGASRAMSGDFAGAGMEVASGLAGTIPGVGTAASVGIDAALAAKDAGVFDKEKAPASAPAPAPAPATAKVATASTSLGGAIAATADTSKKQEAMLTPDQEKEAKPLIDEMLSLQKELLMLNNNFSMPRDEYKAKRKEIGSKQAAITKQLDSIKSGFGQEVLGYTSGPGALDASKETSSSVIDKMKQDSKTISEESSKVTPKEKVTGEKIISQTTTKVKTTSSDSLTKDASSAQESLVSLDEKYAKKAAPIVEKLRAEGKIEGVVTDEDYQQIPELQAIKKEKDAEKLSLETKIKPGLVSSVSSEVARTSTENADMTREMGGKGGANNTVVSNNVSSNNTTKFVPMKSSPRAENTGSALDRYTSRITTY